MEPLSIKTGIQVTAKIPGGGYALLSIVEWYHKQHQLCLYLEVNGINYAK